MVGWLIGWLVGWLGDWSVLSVRLVYLVWFDLVWLVWLVGQLVGQVIGIMVACSDPVKDWWLVCSEQSFFSPPDPSDFISPPSPRLG